MKEKKATNKLNILLSAVMLLCFVLCACSNSETIESSNKGTARPYPNNADSKFHLGAPYPESEEYEVRAYGNYPHIVSVPACGALQAAFAKHLLGMEDGVSGFINTGDKQYILDQFLYRTNIGNSSLLDSDPYERMEASTYDLLLTTILNDSEQSYVKSNGANIIQKTIASDALVFYVSSKNPLDGLTVEQVRGIYSGKILNWSEVGGDNIEILAYENLDALEHLPSLIMKGEALKEALTEKQMIPSGIPGGDPYEIENIATYKDAPESIGFGYLSSLQFSDDVKLLKIEGNYPKIDEIKYYPLSIQYCAIYYNEDEKGLVGEFVEWIVSSEGQKIVSSCGYALPFDNTK